MQIDINSDYYIDSNALNWRIRSDKEAQPDDALNVELGTVYEVGLGHYRELHALIKDMAAGGMRFRAASAADLAGAQAVSDAIDAARAEIELAFATSLTRAQLASTKAAFVVLKTDDWAGWRFSLHDPLSVHRQQWIKSKAGWESTSYYSTLGHAVAKALTEAARRSAATGAAQCLDFIAKTKSHLLAARQDIPAAVFCAVSPRPETPFKNC